MRVLVPVEDPLFASLLLDFIVRHKWPDDTEFVLLNVIEPFLFEKSASLSFAGLLSMSEKELLRAANEMLTQSADILKEHLPECRVESLVREGRVLKEILDLARNEQFDLVIAGSHGRSGFNQLMLGSVSLGVVNEASCPVILVKPDLITLKRWEQIPDNARAELNKYFAYQSIKPRTLKVMLCVESPKSADRMVKFLSAHSFASNCNFHIISVLKPLKLLGVIASPESAEMKERLFGERMELLVSMQSELKKLLSDSEVDLELVEGDAKKLIIAKAREWEADLIVIGSRAPGQNPQQSMGSVALNVLAAAPCSVMLLQDSSVCPEKSAPESLLQVG